MSTGHVKGVGLLKGQQSEARPKQTDPREERGKEVRMEREMERERH